MGGSLMAFLEEGVRAALVGRRVRSYLLFCSRGLYCCLFVCRFVLFLSCCVWLFVALLLFFIVLSCLWIVVLHCSVDFVLISFVDFLLSLYHIVLEPLLLFFPFINQIIYVSMYFFLISVLVLHSISTPHLTLVHSPPDSLLHLPSFAPLHQSTALPPLLLIHPTLPWNKSAKIKQKILNIFVHDTTSIPREKSYCNISGLMP